MYNYEVFIVFISIVLPSCFFSVCESGGHEWMDKCEELEKSTHARRNPAGNNGGVGD